MSWLARSFATLTAVDLDDDGDDGDPKVRRVGGPSEASPVVEEGAGGGGSEAKDPGRGVKEDLSELTKTLTRQFWGVASFLAPPPTASPPSDATGFTRPSETADRSDLPDPTVSGLSDYSEASDSPRVAGIRSDFAEIGGRFRSEISKLSHNKAVSEISKIASSFLQFGASGEEEEEEEENEKELQDEDEIGGRGVIGVTEEVLAFARNISMHPETWLDFPLFPDDDDADDFDMSDAQQEHALAVEHFVPRLAALRIELCPSHMSEGCFWKIYFVLLHPRLNKHDAELLSTPQIVEARALMLQDLQNRMKSEADKSASGASSSMKEDNLPGPPVTTSGRLYENMPSRKPSSEGDNPIGDSETEKYPVTSTEIKIVDKSVIEEEMPTQAKNMQSNVSNIPIEKYEDNGDEWLEEENIELGNSTVTSIPIGNEDDVSFSDLEDDEGKVPTISKAATSMAMPGSQATSSKGQVQLSQTPDNSVKDRTSASPEAKEANEWSDLDDIDVM